MKTFVGLLGVLALVTGCASTHSKSKSFLGEPLVESFLEGERESSEAGRMKAEGYDRYLTGDFFHAIHQLETYLLLVPENQDIWVKYLLYYCYTAIGGYEKALSLAKELVQTYPYLSLGYQQVGLAEFGMGKTNQAVRAFIRAAEFEEHLPAVHFYLGLAYKAQKEIKKRDQEFQIAEREYLQILEKNPGDFAANYELANLYLAWKKSLEKVPLLIQKGKENIDQVARKGEPKALYENFYLPLLEGVLLSVQARPNESLTVLFNCLKNAPTGIRAGLAELYFYIGENYQMLNEAEKAERFYVKALELDPEGIYSQEAELSRRIVASELSSSKPSALPSSSQGIKP